MEAPCVWIVIPTWNRRDDTLQCLASVYELEYRPFQVLIVDNASQDGTRDAVAQYFPDAHILALNENKGATGASNLGFAYGLSEGAQYILRLDSDTYLAPDALSYLVQAVLDNRDRRIGIVTPKIFFADRPGTIWYAGAEASLWPFGARTIGRGEPDSPRYDKPRVVDYAWSAGMLITRDVLLATGGFDEDFFVYFEEIDFCIRARRKGFSIYYVPFAHMWHKVNSEAGSNWTAWQWNRGKVLLYRKHSYGVRRLLLVGSAFVYALFRAISPSIGRGNRGPLLAALRGLLAGLTYPISNADPALLFD